MITIEVLEEFAVVVHAALREKANEFYAAIARAPNDDNVPAWRDRAEYLDGEAARIIERQRKSASTQ